jgi:putative flippase GtrA
MSLPPAVSRGGKTHSSALLGEFLRYFGASALALALDFLVLTLLVEWAHWPVLLAASCGYLAGTLVAFAMSVRWAFSQRSFASWKVGLGLFALIGLIGLGVNLLVMALAVNHLGWAYPWAKAAAACASFLFNFVVRRAALFVSPR